MRMKVYIEYREKSNPINLRVPLGGKWCQRDDVDDGSRVYSRGS